MSGILVNSPAILASAVPAIVAIPSTVIWGYSAAAVIFLIWLAVLLLRGDWQKARGFDKLIATPKGEVTHLFNLADDPFELTNLAHDSAQKLKLASLKAQMLAQMKKLGDGLDPSGLRIR